MAERGLRQPAQAESGLNKPWRMCDDGYACLAPDCSCEDKPRHPGLMAEAKAVRGCQLLAEAVREACRLIWVEDAVWTAGGPAALDAWVDKYGPLVGFSTKDGIDA